MSADGSRALERIQRECRAYNCLWEDPEFPTIQSSLFYSDDPLHNQTVAWLRPHDIVRKQCDDGKLQPELFVDNPCHRFTLVQGKLGDCWLVAALSALACEGDKRLSRVIPMHQSFEKSRGYCGIFRVNFWRFGRWVEVLVDDQLPTINNGQLVFIRSRRKNEFWGCIVEKAYAKLNGSYQAFSAGLLGDAMEDFTGGITESILFSMPQAVPENLGDLLYKSVSRLALVLIGIDGSGNGQTAALANGLVSGHTYSIIDMRNFKFCENNHQKLVNVLRIRNPWGNRIEWNGAWSVTSKQWKCIDVDEFNKMEPINPNNGEFWMEWKDFKTNFSTVHICHLDEQLAVQSSRTQSLAVTHWRVGQWCGKWLKGESDGGRPFFQESFWKNPQYRFQVFSVDNVLHKTTVIVSLQQRDIRFKMRHGAKYLSIGFVIYKVRELADSSGKMIPDPLPFTWFSQRKEHTAAAYYFAPSRSNVRSFGLSSGEYVIVPCTWKPNHPGDFLLRIFMEKGCAKTEQGTWRGDLPRTIELDVKATLKNHSQVALKQPPRPQFNDQQQLSAQIDSVVKPQNRAVLLQTFLEHFGQNEALNVYTLRICINNLLEPNFHLRLEPCRSLLALMQTEYGEPLGTLQDNFERFRFLWSRVFLWRSHFEHLDAARTGNVTGDIALGKILPPHLYNLNLVDCLLRRFANARTGCFTFGELVSALAATESASAVFSQYQKHGVAKFDQLEFMKASLSV